MDVGAITQQMREFGWVLGDQLGEGGGGAVHLCFSVALADEVSLGIQKIATTVALAGQPPIDLRAHAVNSIIAPMHRAFVTSPDLIGVAKLLKEPGPHGDLESHQPDFHGKPLAVLKKIRPVVNALAVMHGRGVFHRDIKPSNILVGRNGDWVLSDLGVVFDSEADRLTVDQQTLVSKDWRPDWIAAQRLDDYGPDVDVFGLAKVT